MNDDNVRYIYFAIILIGCLLLACYIPIVAYDQGITRGQCEGLGMDKRVKSIGVLLCCEYVDSTNVHCESLEYLLKQERN